MPDKAVYFHPEALREAEAAVAWYRERSPRVTSRSVGGATGVAKGGLLGLILGQPQELQDLIVKTLGERFRNTSGRSAEHNPERDGNQHERPRSRGHKTHYGPES